MTLEQIHGPKLPIIPIMIRMFLFHLIRGFQNSFSIDLYATVTTGQGALIIGGWIAGKNTATVACYNNSGWTKLDDLQSARHQHRAIINGDKVYVIGGDGKQ